MKAGSIKKRRLQRARKAKEKNLISAVKSKPREDPRRVALEARQRVLGVSADDATQPEAATVLGRLKLSGVITDTMYEAGKRYLELYLAYLKAIKAPTGLAVTNSTANEGDCWSLDYIEWAVVAVARYEVMKAALCDDGLRIPVEMVIIGDIEPVGLANSPLLAGLRLLARKMGLENLPRAA